MWGETTDTSSIKRVAGELLYGNDKQIKQHLTVRDNNKNRKNKQIMRTTLCEKIIQIIQLIENQKKKINTNSNNKGTMESKYSHIRRHTTHKVTPTQTQTCMI